MSKYIVYSSSETSVFIFLFPGIRQLVISPNDDEDNEACQQSQEILRMTDGLSHMRKSTGAGQQEIYLHREEPALNLFPALTNHSSNHADSHTDGRPQMLQSTTLSQCLLLLKIRQSLHHPVRESFIRNPCHHIFSKESLQELLV